MSYARFSCDDFRSDVHCYESEDGFVVHVAANRKDPGELPEPVGLDDPEAWLERDRIVAAALSAVEPEPIDHPAAGEMYVFSSAEECITILEWLRGEGFHVPDHALEALRSEVGNA